MENKYINQSTGSYIQSNGKSGRKQKEDLRVNWGKAKWSSELNAGWKMFMARGKKMAPCNFMTCALKLWMAYTFHLGKHGVKCSWSPLNIDSSSPSRKRHGEFWTLNSPNQKWYGEKEIGILKLYKNRLHVFPFSRPVFSTGVLSESGILIQTI